MQRFTDPKPERDHHQSWSLILDDDGGGTITIRASADVLAEMLRAVDTQERGTRVAAKAGGAAGPPDLVRVAQGLSSRRVDALLCHYHHRSIHQRGWTINGTANRRLEFVGPDGRDSRTRARVGIRDARGCAAAGHR